MGSHGRVPALVQPRVTHRLGSHGQPHAHRVLGHAKTVGYTNLYDTAKSYACVLGRMEHTDLISN
ncbi:Chaperone DnaJ [Gossypium arboreum]|uniref:Chaperone DnaJ n=1 Tax=Gossypium arboreum TaxID=29729 RepID=A0A0B0N9F6_GOSAR|nr:Chaperone DnaJ [Gossypium arboreum]